MTNDRESSSAASPAGREVLWHFNHPNGSRFRAVLSPIGDRWELRVTQDGKGHPRTFDSRASAVTFAQGMRGRIMRDGVMS